MGKQIKSTGVILDASSMASAPVSPTGTVALRPKPDASQFQYSANGGAWTDFSTGGSTPRLDQVLDPNTNKAFAMGNNTLAFQFGGADAEDELVVESATNAAGSGVVMLIRTQGTTSTKAPLRVDANGAVALTVDTAGNVGVRAYDSNVDFNVTGVSQFQTGTGDTDTAATVYVERTSNASNGRKAFYVVNTQGGTQDGSTHYKGVLFEHDLQFTSTGLTTRGIQSDFLETPATTNRVVYNIAAYLNEDTNDVTGSYTAFFAETKITASSTHSGVYRAFYAQNPGATWAANYGFLAASGLSSGFGTTTPAATLHVSGTVRFTLGSDARGDSFYRSSSGDLARLAIGTVGQVWTVTDIGSGVLEPRWATPAGGGGSGNPGGSASEIQFRSNATTFGAVTSSSVSGADVTWGGIQTQTLTNTVTSGTVSYVDQNITISPASASTAEHRLIDHGVVFGTAQNTTTVRLRYSNVDHNQAATLTSYFIDNHTFNQTAGTVTTMGAYFAGMTVSSGTTVAATGIGLTIGTNGGTLTGGTGYSVAFDNSSGTITTASGFRISVSGTIGTLYGIRTPSASLNGFGIDTPATTLHVSGTIRFALGSDADGDIWYRSSSNVTRLGIGTTAQYLRSNGSVPSWAALSGSDISTGTVALARGGTGASLTDPNADRILFWDDSAGAVDWLTVSTGLNITGTTLTATGGGGGTPAGSGSEIQYRVDASTFGAVTSSSVSGADVTWAGLQTQTLTKTNTSGTFSYIDQNLTISPASASSAEHRLLDQGVVFGTAQNTTSVRLRYANVDHNQTGTITSFYVDNITYTQTSGTTSTINGYQLGLSVNAGTTSAITAHGSSIGTNGGTITGATGYSVSFDNTSGTITTATGFRVTTSGTIGTLYGIRTPSGSMNGFGTDTPSTTCHIIGTFRVDLTSDATGDTYYRNATPVITRLGIGGSGTFYKSTGSAPSWASLAASDIASGTLTLARGGTGSSLTDPNADRIMFWDDSAGVVDWLTVSTGLSISGTTLTATGGGSPGGSGTELQYRSGASTFGAVSNTSVSGSTVTLGTSTDFVQVGGSASMILQGDASSQIEMRYAANTVAPLLITKRARGTWGSKSGLVADDDLFREDHYGYYDASSLRLAGQQYFRARSTWSSTEASTIYGISTMHGASVVPLMRQVLGGFKILTDNTLSSLFTFSFAAADHKAAGGEIELIFIAKQTSGSNQIACYRRVMNFTVYHDAATNTGVMQVILNTGGNSAIETGGTFDIKHTTGSSGSEVAITTSLLPTTFDSVTYKVLVDSSFTVSAMYCFFNVRMNGEVEMTLA